jgi:hypothetical protein
MKKINFKSAAVLQNIYVLYLTFFAAIAEILYLLASGEERLVLIFILSAIAVSLYNKNMIIILIAAIVFVNLVKYGVLVWRGLLRENYDGISQDDTNTKVANLVNDKNTVTRDLKEKIPEEEAKLNKLKSHVTTLNSLINQTDQLNDTLKDNEELYKEQNELLAQVKQKNADLKNQISQAQLAISGTPS